MVKGEGNIKQKILFLNVFFFFVFFSCHGQQSDDFRLLILREKITLLLKSFNEDREIINSPSLEKTLDTLKHLLIEENNHDFFLETETHFNRLKIFKNNFLLAELSFAILWHLTLDEITVFLHGRLFDSKSNPFIQMRSYDYDGISGHNITFMHMYRYSDEYFFRNYYHTDGYKAYVIHKYALTPSTPLIKTTVIFREIASTPLQGDICLYSDT